LLTSIASSPWSIASSPGSIASWRTGIASGLLPSRACVRSVPR
jgi:hypothetical protein